MSRLPASLLPLIHFLLCELTVELGLGRKQMESSGDVTSILAVEEVSTLGLQLAEVCYTPVREGNQKQQMPRLTCVSASDESF